MSGPSARLIVVEDDDVIRDQLGKVLPLQGYQVTTAPDAAAAVAAATAAPDTDLVLMDLGLPDLDGAALARRMRELLPEAVIVVLTARTDEIDVVLALDAGADDYLTKPFRLTELLARLRAHLRRRAGTHEGDAALVTGGVRLEPWTRRCYVADEEVALRPKEFDLLAVLLGSAGQAVTRERLIADVWDENWFGSTKTLDMHVSMLRRKLEGSGVVITTLRGFGYRLEADERVG